jgi:hypothetical protein
MDRKEIWASSGKPPEEVLPLSFRISEQCYTIRGRDNTNPIAMFGVVDGTIHPEHFRTGIIWMLGTDEIKREAISICRGLRPWVGKLGEDYSILWNLVWNANKLHLRWIRWLGFTIEPPIKHGPFGERFNPFYKWSKNPF